MKILIVGGSGLIGGEAALYLQAQGHDVTIMSRKSPSVPLLESIPYMQGDYVNDDFSDGRLRGFDSLVFSAAADVRNLMESNSESASEFYSATNDEAVPKFFRAARDAGIKRAVYIGTFYPRVAPEKVGECPYVTSRHNTDKTVRALGAPGFSVCSLDLPFVLGYIPGQYIPHIEALVLYARGQMELPIFAPPGRTTHISSRAVAEAVCGALLQGENGRSYLLGDESYSWKEYLELWFEAAGNPQQLEVRSDDHPLLPNAIMFAGVGADVEYEPDDTGFHYSDSCIKDLVKVIVKEYSAKG